MSKNNQRISKLQKERLVEYMSANLEFARGQFNRLNSNVHFKEKWESLAISLNSLGGSDKSVEQWIKCWIDLKAAVKKHINNRRSIMNKTGGGSWQEIPRDLNPLEEEILKIITTDAVDGDGYTPESGAPLNESFSIEILEGEEDCVPIKKLRKIHNIMHQQTLQNTKKRASKMHSALLSKIEDLSYQNKLILEKIIKIEDKLN
ncbi:uncharacterized protein LOC124419447 isoform X2 [Lucilia cuprina]|uniref:uncharacterized protein LOC124419447 isoform X2 n=1 Tax=Lucilia cuprina TaxID=7375 RepID=UPI001F06C72A|nr:uncharacterized protein LOC124419447 isoform X2 [Lucilia cuprina]